MERRIGSTSPGSARASVTRACVNCQKRKSRCLRRAGRSAPCSYCAKAGKTCRFDEPPDRTPLTRRKLDAAEAECKKLKTLLRSLNPDVDIESALRGLRADQPSRHEAAVDEEAVDERSSHGYEWSEKFVSPELSNQASDGMAMLATNDSGYLGSSSGSHLLGEIGSSILVDPTGEQPASPNRQAAQRRGPGDVPSPESLDLPLSHVASRLIDAYFTLYGTCYPVLHERTFRDKIAARHFQPSPRSPGRVVYYMVLTIGHWLTSSEIEHSQSSYYSAARSALSIQMLESGTTETVQAFLLIGNYLQKRDRTNTGYNFIGLACRMGLGLGLHRDLPEDGSTLAQERRRQLFWTMCCFDSGFSITTGRPPTMIDGFTDTRVPLNIDDKGLSLKNPVPPEVNYPTTYSAIIAQAKLVKIAGAIYHEFLLAKTAGARIEYGVAEGMERGLARWRAALPSYFQSDEETPPWFRVPRAVVLWKEQNLRILLWRGTQMHHGFLPGKMSAAAKCLRVAMQNIHDIGAFCSAYTGVAHPGLVWYATYFLVQATLVLEAYAVFRSGEEPHADPAIEQAEWQHSVVTARACLEVLARSGKSASRCLEILDRIHARFQFLPSLENNPGPTVPHSVVPCGPGQPGTGPLPVDVSSLQPQDVTGSYGANWPARSSTEQPNSVDDTEDPDLRSLLDGISTDFIDNMPLDLLLGNWAC